MARKLLRTAIACGLDKDMKAAIREGRAAFMEGQRAALAPTESSRSDEGCA
jgi:hypothetical protein